MVFDSSSAPKLRFAPSPTGYLHLGNARLAAINWLFAKQQGGTFSLRFDDTDTERSQEKYAKDIQDSMSWLGIDWDTTIRQSDRVAIYAKVIKRLKSQGRLYACFETPQELDEKRKLAAKLGRPPVYDRSSLKLSDSEKAALIEKGLVPHWRFLLNDASSSKTASPTAWSDLAAGDISYDVGHISDPVLVRGNGRVLYTLSSVIDDIDDKVTHVVRGADHITNTAVQIQIFQALGGQIPDFAHISLLMDEGGENLSKRLGSLGLRDLRARGYLGEAVMLYLANLGTSVTATSESTIAGAIKDFDFSRFSRNSPKYDSASLLRINRRVLARKTLEEISDEIAEDTKLSPKINPDFWELIRENIDVLGDIKAWQGIIYDKDFDLASLKSSDAGFAAGKNKDLLAIAMETLPAADAWSVDTLKEWLKDVGKSAGVKGRDLFMPIRLSLTGLQHGPDIPAAMLLMGRELVLARLQSAHNLSDSSNSNNSRKEG